MSWIYTHLIRPILFSREAEEIHDLTLKLLSWASRHETLCDAVGHFTGADDCPVEVLGLRFPNPIGLAAGMDKAAVAVPIWEAIGFGFAELGGVTWHGQEGNPRPRLARVPADESLVNRMGFNNPGADAVARQLTHWQTSGRWPHHPVGVNLGKSKITPENAAAREYADLLRVLWPTADFFVVNVSSPNTPGLRKLQDKAALDEILAAMNEVNEREATGFSEEEPVSLNRRSRGGPKPILVKVAPDLSWQALDQIVELATARGVSGLVATNTTIERPPVEDADRRRVYAESGGLSGRPLRPRSTEVIRHLYRQSRGGLPLIGVGGIFDAEDAWEKITAGATLLQVYTGLVYRGPGLARQIVGGIKERLAANGFGSLRDAVGLEHRS